MPFNAGGFFQRLFNWRNDRDAGIKILAERMDQEMDGIVAGINDIVSGEVDWRGPMTGVFGTAAAPAYSFQEDPNTGVYRVSADVLGFSVGGAKKAEVTANGLHIVGTITATNFDASNLNAGTVPVARLPVSVLRNDVANQVVPSYFRIKSGTDSEYSVLELIGPDNIADGHIYSNNASQSIGFGVFDPAGGSTGRRDLLLFYGGGITWGGHTVWHAGNDGAGSGLDADLVKGYVPFDRAGDTVTGNIGIDGHVIINNGDPYVKVNNNSKYLVLSGGSGWSAGAAAVLRGASAAANPHGFEVHTGNAPSLEINSQGKIRAPRQPAFSATAVYSTSHAGALTPVIFGGVDVNIGSHYNPANGYFTAPVVGTYYFLAQAHNSGSSSGYFTLCLRKNGGLVVSNGWSQSNGNSNQVTIACCLYLAQGDNVRVDMNTSKTSNYIAETYWKFMGHLIG
jgi:hypothetical protein